MGLFLSFVIHINAPDVLFIGGAAVEAAMGAGDGRRCGEVRPAPATCEPCLTT